MYTYYKGQFRSQFRLESPSVILGHGVTRHSLQLEEKWQLFNSIKILESDYDSQAKCSNGDTNCKCKLHSDVVPSINGEGNHWIEVYAGDETKDGRLELIDEYTIFYTNEGLKSNEDVGGFYAHQEKSGKFTGEAFIRVVEDPEKIRIAYAQKLNDEKLSTQNVKKVFEAPFKSCFNRTSELIGRLVPSGKRKGLPAEPSTPPGSPKQAQPGCLDRPIPCFGKGCFNGPTTIRGCFNAAQQPGGCLSMGWLGRLLGLLALLGLLLYLLSLLKSCDRTSGDRVVYVHDTVVVEVIKERVDTIEVVRIDTTKFLKTNKTKTTDVVELPNVQFETDKDILVPGSLPDIQKLAEFLIKNKHVKARILGHTDNVGDSLHNERLSERRAMAVRNLLVQLGVESSRIDYEGFGQRKPKTSNATLEGRLMNRRVEVRLTNMVSQTEETVEVKQL